MRENPQTSTVWYEMDAFDDVVRYSFGCAFIHQEQQDKKQGLLCVLVIFFMSYFSKVFLIFFFQC